MSAERAADDRTTEGGFLTLLGVSHHDTPLDVRERVTPPAEAIPSLLERLAERFGGAAVLSTCNRFEVYVPGAPARDAVLEVTASSGVDRALAAAHSIERHDMSAVRHLFAVASGIDSMVIGEPEVLGQVRAAFSQSIAAGSDDALLSRLFHSAIRTGRKARATTGIGRHALSVSSIAVHEALSHYPTPALASVLVLGAGEAGRVAAEALAERGVGAITVVNRTRAHADAIAGGLGGRARGQDELLAALAEADIVIAATGATEPPVTRSLLEPALARRHERVPGAPLLVLDIAVPRDVEAAARDLPGTVYRDLDDLRAISERNVAARGAEVDAVTALVEEEADRFVEWWRLQQVMPTVAAITAQAEAQRAAQLERTLRALSAEGYDAEAMRPHLEGLTRALVKRLLHDPVTTLRRRGDRDATVEAARALFRLDGASSDPLDAE